MTAWFTTHEQIGERDLAYQLKGLEVLAERCQGKTVLDLGCAEGLVADWLWHRGAQKCDGVDCASDRVRAGRGLVTGNVRFWVRDLNHLGSLNVLNLQYDIVLLLAVLHKVRDPVAVLRFACERCPDLLAIRAPDSVLSYGGKPARYIDIPAMVCASGFRFIQETEGHPDNPKAWDKSKPAWLGIFERCT